ncbi:DMT family transporter [Ectothiorhodospiraceae bacterium WFHF3C12]|nr:DMT family transporter [Ectothiorhodospiraceae bacterium WFHF3C12]
MNQYRHQALLQGAAFIVVSELLLATMSAAIKVVSAELPNEMLVFFRNLFGLAVLLPFALRNGIGGLATRRLPVHLARSLAGVGAMYCFFYTIASIPLAEAILFKLTAPFFIPVIAWLWLSESIPGTAKIAIALGFAGGAMVLQPGFREIPLAGLVGLAGAVLAALAKVAIRRMSNTEPSTRIVFYFGTVATSVSAIPLLWAWQTPGWHAVAWLSVMGVSATIAQLLLTRAYALAPAGQIGPFTYVSVIFGSTYGWLFWDEVPGPAVILGSLLIVAAGILTTRRRRPAADPDSAGASPRP